MKKEFIIFVFLALLLAPVFAERRAMPPLVIPNAAASGLGGSHVAYTDSVFALFVNPAAIMRVQQRSFFTLAPTLYSPQSTFTFMDSMRGLVDDDTTALGNTADALREQKGKIPLGFELREFPLSAAWVANGFGFGLWNRSFLNFNIVGTNLEMQFLEDIVFPVSFAFKILELDRQTLDLGFTVKPFARIWFHEMESILRLTDEDNDFLDRATVPVIMGLGFNLGFLYRWDTGFQVGLTLDDIFTRGSVTANLSENIDRNAYYVPFTLNLGLAYDLKIGRIWDNAPFFLRDSGFALAFDYRDIGGIFRQDDLLNNRNTLLNMGLGLEITTFNIFKFRLGMNEMLPAVGLGLSLGPIKIDAAYYGKEFGNEPGQLSAAALDLSIALRPNARKRDWFWTRTSLLGAFTR